MGRRSKQTFLKRRYTDDQNTHEKLLNISKEMQIKTTMRYHLKPVRMAIIKKSTINAGESAEKSKLSYTVGRNVNWYDHYGEQYGISFKN